MTGKRPTSRKGGDPKAAPKRRAPAKSRAKGKAAKRGPARPRFEPATLADFDAVRQAEERALKAADKQSPLTPAERVERDESIVAMWALGLSPGTIAERVALSREHVGRVLNAHRERRASQPIPSSSELLWDMLERLEALIERTSLLASSGESDAVKLGAIRTLGELMESQAGLWQVMGLVGRRPSDYERAERARDLLRRLLDTLRDLGVPQEQIDEAATRILAPAGAVAGNVVTIEGRAG